MIEMMSAWFMVSKVRVVDLPRRGGDEVVRVVERWAQARPLLLLSLLAHRARSPAAALVGSVATRLAALAGRLLRPGRRNERFARGSDLDRLTALQFEVHLDL